MSTLATLGLVGLASGVASGMFGIGGGAIVTPALCLLTDMAHATVLGTTLTAMVAAFSLTLRPPRVPHHSFPPTSHFFALSRVHFLFDPFYGPFPRPLPSPTSLALAPAPVELQ